MPENIHGLWLGGKLGHLELLTLKSFVKFGHTFNLWTYTPVGSVPPNVVVRDGNEILPSTMIFRYPAEMLLGFGGNSYVGFSELFRYKVLYEKGGWWSDMDVTCLKSLDEVTDEYFFRTHGVLSVVGNIMKCPPKSELMKLCFDRAVIEVNDKQNDWHHAIRILCYYIEFLGLSKFIHGDACNLDRLDKMHPFIKEAGNMNLIPNTWRFIHWMNSVVQKNSYANGSVFEQLLNEHGCVPRKLFL